MAPLSKLEELKVSRDSQEQREFQAANQNILSDQNLPTASSPSFAADMLPTSLPVLFTVVGIAALAATFVNLPLGFDGSYYVLKLLDESAPYVPHNRLGNILLQLPALVASNIGDRLTPAVMAFSFSYAVVPLLCLLSCYLKVRNHNKSLIMWPAISIALVSSVLGPVMISENLIASELAWLLILGIITPPNTLKTIALCLTAAFMATLHPCAVAYLGLAAALSWLYRNNPATNGSEGDATSGNERDGSRRLLTLALLATAVARMACAFVFPAAYESDTLSSQSWLNYGFRLVFTPLMYVEMYAIACGILFLKGKNIALEPSFSGKEKSAGLTRLKAAVVTPLIGLTIAALWSGAITMWDHCFFAGRVIVIPSLVLMICAVLDDRRRYAQTLDGAETISRYRALVTNVAFLGILCVTLVQCTTWLAVKRGVKYELRHNNEAVIDIDAQNYPFGLPLAHWSSGSLSILLQGQTPSKIMLKSEAVQAARENGVYTINTIEPPLSQKWFHLPAGESARRHMQ